MAVLLFTSCACCFVQAEADSYQLRAAAWGADHVGKPWPEYMTGDECLFCHREMGATWGENRHQLSIRLSQPNHKSLMSLGERYGAEVAADVQLLMGSRRVTRFLKRSSEYGKLQLLSVVDRIGKGTIQDVAGSSTKPIHWDANSFADRCAGCHTTAVDSATRAFSAVSLDCFTCHGDVQTDHTTETGHALLSAGNRVPQQVVSICGQCHLRGGTSKSSGFPYANTFVPGDNLFKDYQVDFADESIRARPVLEQHIFLNSRDVAADGNVKTDCMTCHDVHGQNADKHKRVPDSAICATCHVAGSDHWQLRDQLSPASRRTETSQVCDY